MGLCLSIYLSNRNIDPVRVGRQLTDAVSVLVNKLSIEAISREQFTPHVSCLKQHSGYIRATLLYGY